MCEFFSFLADDKVNLYYHDNKIRKAILKGLSNLRADSHASIAEHHFGNSRKEDDYHKFEYNPLTKKLEFDGEPKARPSDEFIEKVYEKVRGIDFSEIVPELIIKPIIHPFEDVKFEGEVTDEILELVKNWDSVWKSVWKSEGKAVWKSVMGSVWELVEDSVWKSEGKSVWKSVKESVWESVWESVEELVEDSVWESAWDSVWKSVRESLGDSVWKSVRESLGESVSAYISSFFSLKTWKYIESDDYINPLQSAIDLWGMGLVPVKYDNKWHLFSYKGEIWKEVE